MAFYHHLVLPKTQFTMNVPVGTTQINVLNRGIDSRAWVSAALVVRIYADSPIWSGYRTCTIYCSPSSIPADEPNTFFQEVGFLQATYYFSATSGLTPSLHHAAFMTPIAPQTCVVMQWVQSIATPAGFTIGVEVIGRDA